jgi:hypothetical protein
MTTANGVDSWARADTDTATNDMYAEVAVTGAVGGGSGLTAPYAAARMVTTSAETFYSAGPLMDPNNFVGFGAGTSVVLNKKVAGANTDLAHTGYSHSNGDVYRCSVVGSTLRAYVNGVLKLTTTDTSITTGTRGGVFMVLVAAGDSASFDNFAVDDVPPPNYPYFIDVSAQVTGTGTTLTPTVPATVATGDVVFAHITSDNNSTLTPPSGEGWALAPSTTRLTNTTALEDAVYYKVWGAGNTDDTTPTFTSSSGTAGWGITLSVFRNVDTTTPIQATAETAATASTTMTAPSASYSGDNRTYARFFSSVDDNNHGSQSEGTLAYGGTSYDQTTGNDYAQSMSYLENVDGASSTSTATMTQGSNGADRYNARTIVLQPPSTGTSANAAAATGTGAAANASTAIAPKAGNATGTGAAVAPAPTVKPNAGLASGTGQAFGAGGTTSTGGTGTGTGTGTANTATPTVAPNAGQATGSGAAQSPAPNVKPNAGLASGTGQAFGAGGTVATGGTGVATGTGAAGAPTPRVAPNGALASGTGTAFTSAVTASGASAVATGTGAAGTPTPAVKPNAGVATGTGTAGTPAASISGSSAVATGTGTAGAPAPSVKANAGAASGSGSAFDATVSTTSSTSANAGLASGTGQAFNASVAISTPSGGATGAGAAGGPSSTVKAGAGVASGTGTAASPKATVAAITALATAVATALSPRAALAVHAGIALATGTAYDPTAHSVGIVRDVDYDVGAPFVAWHATTTASAWEADGPGTAWSARGAAAGWEAGELVIASAAGPPET